MDLPSIKCVPLLLQLLVGRLLDVWDIPPSEDVTGVSFEPWPVGVLLAIVL